MLLAKRGLKNRLARSRANGAPASAVVGVRVSLGRDVRGELYVTLQGGDVYCITPTDLTARSPPRCPDAAASRAARPRPARSPPPRHPPALPASPPRRGAAQRAAFHPPPAPRPGPPGRARGPRSRARGGVPRHPTAERNAKRWR